MTYQGCRRHPESPTWAGVPSRVQLGPLWGHYFFKKFRTTQVTFSSPLIKIIYVDGKSSSSPKRLTVSVTSWIVCLKMLCLFNHSVVSYSLQPHRLYACSLPGSSVHRILQARILEWVAIPFCGDLPYPGIKPRSPTLQADFFTIWATREAQNAMLKA